MRGRRRWEKAVGEGGGRRGKQNNIELSLSRYEVIKININNMDECGQAGAATDNRPPADEEPDSRITVDLKLLKLKQQLLAECCGAQDEERILEVMRSWPTPCVQQAAAQQSVLMKTNNAKYIGEVCNQMFHGYGVLLYNESERFYEGEFQNNCKHGDGLEYIRGDIYVGKFVNNKPEDPNGIFYWKNKDLFMGSFLNGMKHGTGRWESGSDFYEGTWKLNRPEGKGHIHTTLSDYQGEVKGGYKHGRGSEMFSNGDHYEGLYANGKPEGDGVYRWNNGAIYRGQFKNGIRYGYGEWSYGSEKYEGEYVNDKRSGQGVYKWGGENWYKGEFMDDLRHGFGEMHWGQNAYYKGEWKEGAQTGFGELWEDGKLVSKGLFEDGKHVKSPEKSQKLMKSRYSYNSNEPRKTRYPAIQPRDRNRNSSYNSTHHNNSTHHSNSTHHNNSNLIPIDELPRAARTKKSSSISNSFSHKPRKTVSHNVAHPVELPKPMKPGWPHHEPDRHHQEDYFHSSMKRGAQRVQAPLIGSGSKNKVFKKRVNVGSMAGVQSVGVHMEMDPQLGPIKWRNFTHVKDHGEPSTNS